MFEDLLNNQVEIITTTRGQNVFEYKGMLIKENNETVTLKNVSINYAITDFQKNVFGGNITTYKQNIEKVILNKKYIISCNQA